MSKNVTLQERNRIVEAFGERQELLCPASIDESVDGKISYSSLEKGLTVRFSFVEGMQKGGRYVVLLKSDEEVILTLPGTIPEDHKDIVVSLTADQAFAFRGQQITLQYLYSEFPPDHTFSPTTHFSVEGELYRPIVDEAVDGVIPISAVSRGVNLRIKAALSLEENAVVSVFWVGSHSEACFVKYLIVQPGQSEKDIVVPVATEFLEPNKSGHVHVIYTVHSDRGTWTSQLVRLEVAGDLEMPVATYWAPEEMGGIPARLLHIDESGKIPMQLPTQGMSEGDFASFIFVSDHFGAKFVFRLPVTRADIAEGYKRFDLPIPFTLLSGGFVTFMAIVERQSGGAVGSPVNKLFVDL